MNLLLEIYGKVLLENEFVEEIYLYLQDGKIQSIVPLTEIPSQFQNAEKIKIEKDQVIVPGFIDEHIHGAAGSDVMDATTESLTTIAKALPAEGTTSFLATTITQKQENIEDFCQQCNGPGEAEILGIHLEGPFINKKRKGAQPEEFIIQPNLELFKKWQL